MTVKELIAWLSEFHDQDATVEVVVHRRDGGSYYEQGGTARTEAFDPDYSEYTDLRDNQFYKGDNPPHTLLLGVIDG